MVSDTKKVVMYRQVLEDCIEFGKDKRKCIKYTKFGTDGCEDFLEVCLPFQPTENDAQLNDDGRLKYLQGVVSKGFQD